MRTEGVDGIILGCSELPILIKEDDFNLSMLDLTFLHAQLAADSITS